jgi:hypothetical protein
MTALQPEGLIGSTALDPNVNKTGEIGQFYFDHTNGQPNWVTVSTGRLRKQSFAPAGRAAPSEDGVMLSVEKDVIEARAVGRG